MIENDSLACAIIQTAIGDVMSLFFSFRFERKRLGNGVLLAILRRNKAT